MEQKNKQHLGPQTNQNPSSGPLYQSTLTSSDALRNGPSSFLGLSSSFWKRTETTVSSTRAAQVASRTYLNSSIDKYGTGRPTGRPRAYRGTSTGKESLTGLTNQRKEQEQVYGDDRVGAQLVKRESSMIGQHNRARERQSSTVLSTTSIRNTLNPSKPNSGRQTIAFRNREKSNIPGAIAR